MPYWRPELVELQRALPHLGPLTYVDSGGWKHVYTFAVNNVTWALLFVPVPTGAQILDDEDHALMHNYMRARIKREIKILEDSTCSSLVKLGPVHGEEGAYFEGTMGDRSFIWFTEEFVVGENLRKRIRRNEQPSLQEVIVLTDSLVDCLEDLKRQKVVHRDIKPNNIIRSTASGELRFVLLDAGVALDEAGTRLTFDGRPQGTTRYMSPEQRANQQLDWRSDLYAIGITVFEYATSIHPFVTDGHTLADAESTSTERVMRLLTDTRPDLPEELHELLGSILKKKPELRVGNIPMLKQAIKAIREV